MIILVLIALFVIVTANDGSKDCPPVKEPMREEM